jgi:hypothetical protein
MQHPTTTTPAKDLLTAQDVAAMLVVTTGWVYAQSRKGRILDHPPRPLPTLPPRRDPPLARRNRTAPRQAAARPATWAATPGREVRTPNSARPRHRTAPATAPRPMVPGASRDTLGTQAGGASRGGDRDFRVITGDSTKATTGIEPV